ncbi:MAG: hypothetical protein CVV24_07300 [Ignavibacteriae bacterium HGW-Ignavibacteriae-3]|nr:MAG: hypothetical protein CVV24_07300 [Ignavibacteriae bacterium HGW-Ignavibacteriae-3]
MIKTAGRIFCIICILVVSVKCTFNGEVTNSSASDSTVPLLIQPVNNSFDQSVIQTFKWEFSGAVSYDVFLDKVNPPLKIVAAGINIKSYIHPLPLEHNTNYYWRVGANFADGTQKVSQVQKFTTTVNINPGSGGYALYLKSQSTALPNLVQFLFRVVDLNNKGISTLKFSDFELFEDGLPLQSESIVEIKKQDELPYKIRTVLMLDNSTSLTDAELISIRNAAVNFIGKIRPNQEVSIYQFSENVEMLADFTGSKDSLSRSVARYKSGKNTTGLYSAVIKGASLWQDNYNISNPLQGAMIIFTDGKETSTPTPQALSDAITAVTNKFVFTIGLRGKDALDEETLRKIGTAGFYGINDLIQLENQFTLIQNSIIDYANSFYQLNYKSPRRGGGDYSLLIRVKGNPYTGSDSFIIGKYNSAGFYSKKGIQ